MKNKNGKLFIVATPIGNLSDITLRAIETLKMVDNILCEDTRVTSTLLSYHSITKSMIVYNDHSSSAARDKILAKLQQGKNLALVSDAGTPLISDPGYKLIKFLRENEIDIETIPGPCSAIAALTLSALPSDRFTFLGFLPQKTSAKEKIFEEFRNIGSTLIFFESPNRLIESLVAMNAYFSNRDVAIAKELTKLYQAVVTGSLEQVIEYFLENEDKLRGEFILLLSPPNTKEEYNEEEIIDELNQLLKKMSLRDAVKAVSEQYPLSKKEVYKLALTLKELS
jgi:16S rRNA (cytidine1402-2'-O)-methyltransferase